MFKEFVDTLKTYKELVLILMGLVVAAVTVRDYFATKEEVEILKCQAENGIAIVESRMNSDQLTKRIIAIKVEIDDAKTKLANAKVKNPEKSAGVVSLALEEQRSHQDLAREHETLKRAAENLKPGVCEKAVRRK
jgi:hypothetical protein